MVLATMYAYTPTYTVRTPPASHHVMAYPWLRMSLYHGKLGR